MIGETRRDSGTDPGPPAVCQTIRGSHWHTLWHSAGPPQVTQASYWEGWPVGCLHVGGCGGGACDFPTPSEEAVSLGEEPEPQEEWATTLHTPAWPEEASEPEGAISSGVMVDAWRQLPPGFAELLAIQSGPPSPWGCGFPSWYTPVGLAGSNTSRGNADDNHPEHLDGGAGILLWDQDHFQDMPAFNSTQFPRLTWHQPGNWGPWVSIPLLNSMKNLKSGEYLLMEPNKTWC